jgi:malonyl-CoA/methylmalonyl-CoA synthetase
MEELPLVARARRYGSKVAVRAGFEELTYQELLDRSQRLAASLLNEKDDLAEARIAFLAPSGFDYVTMQWAIWRAGGVAVPLSLSAAKTELEYTLQDSGAACVASSPGCAEKIAPLCQERALPLFLSDEMGVPSRTLPAIALDRRAMILYTSGTTSKPKGVVTTHANIAAQIESLVKAWEWQASDSIPLFLPLHHIHGIINILGCALWSGATLEAFPYFDMPRILGRVAERAYTLFMAVPTIYAKLVPALESLPAAERERITQGFASMRLMVSGSAALPVSLHEKWAALTGQTLLERYGMTEIGMALSNPYPGERRPGTVGQPLPFVDVRLKSETGELVTEEGQAGEIQVRGLTVFREYWNRPEITATSFDEGWFRTGDVAVREDGYYRILGRQSVDIIKSGGYKLSALEIESVLLEHPAISECAVIGLPDDTWGEVVAVAVVLHQGNTLGRVELEAWCRERLSSYRIPRKYLEVETLPRNAMGKLSKPSIRDLFGKRSA